MENQDKNNNKNQENKRPQDEQELNFQKREEIRMARESGNGETYPTDLGPDDRTRKLKHPDQNFDSVHVPTGGASLEDRDTNDGDANTENN